MKILLVGNIHKTIHKRILDMGLHITTDIEKEDESVVGIVVRGGFPIDKSFMDKFQKLKLIISAGVGIDNIDMEEAHNRLVKVANCPNASTISVAEHTIALFASATRHIINANNNTKNGTWDRSTTIGNVWHEKTAGIIGFGRIGSNVARLLTGLGLRIIVFDPYVEPETILRSGANQSLSLLDLCKDVNYVFIHVPKNVETEQMIDIKCLGGLKQINGIVNTSRGGVVNEESIITLLSQNRLGFYATDVFSSEPEPDPRLLSFENVIATPHIGANTQEAQIQIALDVAIQIDEYFVQNILPSSLVSEL